MGPKKRITKKQPPKKTAPKNKGKNKTKEESKITTPTKPIQRKSEFDIVDIKEEKQISKEGMYCA